MTNEYKIDKISGFLYKALACGCSYDEAWNMLISSSAGKNILNDVYAYVYHIQGATSFYYAADEFQIKKAESQKPSLDKIDLLAEFIEFAHEHNIPYEKMFKKESLSNFINNCGDFLGNYDEKLLLRIA